MQALQTLGCYAGADEPSDSPNSGLAATMVKAGFVPTREPFLLSLCSAIRGSILRGIQVLLTLTVLAPNVQATHACKRRPPWL